MFMYNEASYLKTSCDLTRTCPVEKDFIENKEVIQKYYSKKNDLYFRLFNGPHKPAVLLLDASNRCQLQCADTFKYHDSRCISEKCKTSLDLSLKLHNPQSVCQTCFQKNDLYTGIAIPSKRTHNGIPLTTST